MRRIETWDFKQYAVDVGAMPTYTAGEEPTIHCLSPSTRYITLGLLTFYGYWSSRWVGGDASQLVELAVSEMINMVGCESDLARIATVLEEYLPTMSGAATDAASDMDNLSWLAQLASLVGLGELAPILAALSALGNLDNLGNLSADLLPLSNLGSLAGLDGDLTGLTGQVTAAATSLSDLVSAAGPLSNLDNLDNLDNLAGISASTLAIAQGIERCCQSQPAFETDPPATLVNEPITISNVALCESCAASVGSIAKIFDEVATYGAAFFASATFMTALVPGLLAAVIPITASRAAVFASLLGSLSWSSFGVLISDYQLQMDAIRCAMYGAGYAAAARSDCLDVCSAAWPGPGAESDLMQFLFGVEGLYTATYAGRTDDFVERYAGWYVGDCSECAPAPRWSYWDDGNGGDYGTGDLTPDGSVRTLSPVIGAGGAYGLGLAVPGGGNRKIEIVSTTDYPDTGPLNSSRHAAVRCWDGAGQQDIWLATLSGGVVEFGEFDATAFFFVNNAPFTIDVKLYGDSEPDCT